MRRSLEQNVQRGTLTTGNLAFLTGISVSHAQSLCDKKKIYACVLPESRDRVIPATDSLIEYLTKHDYVIHAKLREANVAYRKRYSIHDKKDALLAANLGEKTNGESK